MITDTLSLFIATVKRQQKQRKISRMTASYKVKLGAYLAIANAKHETLNGNAGVFLPYGSTGLVRAMKKA